jgi:hypothetical protein
MPLIIIDKFQTAHRVVIDRRDRRTPPLTFTIYLDFDEQNHRLQQTYHNRLEILDF